MNIIYDRGAFSISPAEARPAALRRASSQEREEAWRPLPGLPPVARMSVAPSHAAFLTEDGALWCLGDNRCGQCAPNSTSGLWKNSAHNRKEREKSPPWSQGTSRT